MLSWTLARHVFYIMVCYSVWAHTPTILPTGCFKGSNGKLEGPFDAPTDSYTYLLEPLTNSSGLVCYNQTVKWSFLSVLLFLQAITIMWFTMIVQVALRVLRGGGADDVRSDDEGDEVDDDGEDLEGGGAEARVGDFVYEEARPFEEDVGVEDIDLKNWERRTGVKRQTVATGVSLPGHSDRKELLGRIGCEKQVD